MDKRLILAVELSQTTSEWGSQRIKGLSITNAILHTFKKRFTSDSSISQENVETSLIGQFMYPKHGPGQLWEEVAKLIIENGGEIHHGNKVVGIESDENRLNAIKVLDKSTGEFKKIEGDYFLSTMPVKDLINSFEDDLPCDVSEVAQGLM